MKRILFLLVSINSFFATSNAGTVANQLRSVCAESLEVTEGKYGKEYSIAPTRISQLGEKVVIASNIFKDGKNLTKLTFVEGGNSSEILIPQLVYKRILLTEESVWFLSDLTLTEFKLSEKRIMGSYSTFPRPFENVLTQRARGFTYRNGFIFIAHGELGVAVFDAKNRKHYAVWTQALQRASLAGAVIQHENYLFVLQGAYHPEGFNGVAVVDLNSGATKAVAYAPASGVVDPYSSTMMIQGNQLVINNSGWIHTLSLTALYSGKTPQAPKWIPVSEVVESAGGPAEIFLMIEGDFAFVEDQLLACSSIAYVPKDQRRPIKDWRMIQERF